MTVSTTAKEDVLSRYLFTCLAAGLSEAITYPLDLLKTLLQLQGPSSAGQQRQSMSSLFHGIVHRSGVRTLFSGLSIAVFRQFLNAGISVGAYPSVRGALLSPGEGKDSAALWKRALAGSVTGCLAQAIAQPTDVVKVRLQADARLQLAGQPPRYTGALHACSRILAQEGLGGFYNALGSSVWRAGIINSAGIASYDSTKQWALRWVAAHEAQLPPAASAHIPAIWAAFVCGIASTVVSCPLDVVKTRLMNAPAGAYRGATDCLLRLVREEGLLSMYKGVLPTYQRQAVWNGVFWVALENVQRAWGHEGI